MKRDKIIVCRACGCKINVSKAEKYRGKKYSIEWHYYIKCPSCLQKIWLD